MAVRIKTLDTPALACNLEVLDHNLAAMAACCRELAIPLRVICTVVNVPAPGRVIVDGGMKTFASYPPGPFSRCVKYPEVAITRMSVERGHLGVSASPHRFRVGERLTIIPLHQSMCVNLHDELVGVRGGAVEIVWPIAGREKVR